MPSAFFHFLTLVGTISHILVDVTINHKTTIQPSGISYINGSLTVTDTLTNQGQLYLEGDLINEGVIDCDSCLSGVTYLINKRDLTQNIGGAQPILLHDGILDNTAGIQLENQLQIANSFTFVRGLVSTDRSDPNHYLHFLPNAITVNTDDFHHVDGFVARSGRGAFELPTGDGDQLHPMGINPSTNTAFVKAAYVGKSSDITHSMFSDEAEIAYTLKTVHSKEFWAIEGTASTSVTISWDESSQLDSWIQATDSLVVAGWDGRIWTNLGQASLEGSLTKGNITSFSIEIGEYKAITLGKNSFDENLPESWISFEGALFGNDIQLDWKLAYENYREKYIVERALDGRFFESIGEVAATGSGTARSSYKYVDRNIAENSPVDALYYRLKKVELDKTFSYSSILEIGLDIKANVDLILYPNPAVTQITLELNYLPFNTRLKIFNPVGQIVYQQAITDNQTIIDVSTWPEGHYFAVMEQEGYSLNKRFYVYH